MKIFFLFIFICISLNLAYGINLTEGEVKTLKKEALRLWKDRIEQEKLEEALSKFEKIREVLPTDSESILYLVRGYYLLGDHHYTNEDLRLNAFDKARKFGEMGLYLNWDYKKFAKDKFDLAIDKLTLNEIDFLFWTAASLAEWAKLDGMISSFRYRMQILTMIKKVDKLKPGYYYGAVSRFLGEFYAVTPLISGGDMQKSKKYFLKAFHLGPDYLGSKTLYAETYLVKKADKKEFKKVLQEVLDSPNGSEEISPENILEKRKAQKLLKKIDIIF